MFCGVKLIDNDPVAQGEFRHGSSLPKRLETRNNRENLNELEPTDFGPDLSVSGLIF